MMKLSHVAALAALFCLTAATYVILRAADHYNEKRNEHLMLLQIKRAPGLQHCDNFDTVMALPQVQALINTPVPGSPVIAPAGWVIKTHEECAAFRAENINATATDEAWKHLVDHMPFMSALRGDGGSYLVLKTMDTVLHWGTVILYCLALLILVCLVHTCRGTVTPTVAVAAPDARASSSSSPSVAVPRAADTPAWWHAVVDRCQRHAPEVDTHVYEHGVYAVSSLDEPTAGLASSSSTSTDDKPADGLAWYNSADGVHVQLPARSRFEPRWR